MRKIIVSLVTGMLLSMVQVLQAGALSYSQLLTPYGAMPDVTPQPPDTTMEPILPATSAVRASPAESSTSPDWRAVDSRLPVAARGSATPGPWDTRNGPQPQLRFRPWGQKGSFLPTPPAAAYVPGYEDRRRFPQYQETINRYRSKPAYDYHRHENQPIQPYAPGQAYQQGYGGPGYAPYYEEETAPPVPAYALPLSAPGDNAFGYRDYTPRYDAPFFPRYAPVPAFDRFSQ